MDDRPTSRSVRKFLPAVGGPLDGQTLETEQLWMGFPGPWSCLSYEDGIYSVDDQKRPTRMVWGVLRKVKPVKSKTR
jgi:hypothetical protein